MAVLGNFVRLEPGVRKRLRLANHMFLDKVIKDPMTGQPKTVRVLQFDVVEEDGQPVRKVFSVTSEKLASSFLPYLEGQRYRNYVVEIEKRGEGFLTDYSVRWMPLP
ncbi:MAG: hypothetical protein QXE52_08285 [Candidatus Caldarchaeum sp.]